MNQDQIIEQHSAGKSLLLHLLPGILSGLCYFALLKPFHQWGYPSLMALMAAAVLTIIPFELGYLLYQGNKKNGRLSLKGIVSYRTRVPLRQYITWVPVLLIVISFIFMLLSPIEKLLHTYLFAWMPLIENGLQGGYSKSALIVTYAMVAGIGAVAAPITEEFYFRGYLMPRMKYAGKWSPIIHSLLFALYHVFTPWMIVTRTIGLLPLIYAVKRRNIYIGIIVHFLLNMIDVVIGISFILGMAQIT